MGKIIFIEVLDRKSNIKERVRIDSFPATVGRGYKNAVIIDDRLVDREHLRLSKDSEAGILVEDLGSVNGSCLESSHERITRHRIPAGGEAILRIGQTIFRLRDDDFVVGPASPLPRAWLGEAGRCLENKLVAFIIFVACFGIHVLMEAEKISKHSIWSDLLGESLAFLVIIAIWAGFWSFLGRVLIHSFRFVNHLAIASLAFILSLLIETGADYMEFFFTVTTFSWIVRITGLAVLLSLLLYAHLSIISELPTWKRLLPSVLISAGFVGIFLLISYTETNDFSTTLPYSSVIKPIGRPLVRTVSTEEFFGNLGKLQSRINTMAAKKPKP
jgi:hypothetical protein